MKASTPVQTLNDLFQLSDDMKHTHPKLHLRLQMVIQVKHMGHSASSTATLLGVSPTTVRRWVKRFEDQGKPGLMDRPRSGRPRLISQKLEDFIVKVATTPPAEISDHLTTWSLNSIRNYLIAEYDEVVSRSSIWRILKRHNIRFRKVEETLVSPDPMYEAKKERIKEAEKEAEENEDVAIVVIDEKGKIFALFYPGRKHMPLESREQVNIRLNKSNGHIILNAAFEPQSNRLWWHFSESRDSEAHLLLLFQLSLDPYSQKCKKVYLLVDNLSTHFTKRVKEFLALHPRFIQLRLPTYAPELSPIERVFKDLQTQGIDNHAFGSVKELKARISAWLGMRTREVPRYLKPVRALRKRKRVRRIIGPQR